MECKTKYLDKDALMPISNRILSRARYFHRTRSIIEKKSRTDEYTSSYLKKYDYKIGQLFSIILSINTIFGTVINFWFIFTIIDYKILRSSKYIGIINLSIVDLCLCLIISPLQIFRELVSINDSTFLPPVLCTIITFLSSWACLSSIFSLTLISLERLMVFKRNRRINRKKFLLLIIITQIISLMLSLINSLMNWLVGLVCLILTTYCYFQMLRLKLNGLITLSKELNQEESKLIQSRRFSKSTNSIEKNSNLSNSKRFSFSLSHLGGKFLRKSDSTAFNAKTLKVSMLNIDNIEKDQVSYNKVTIVSWNDNIRQDSKFKRWNIKRSGTGSMESKAIRKTIIPIVVFYLFWLPYALVQIAAMFSASHLFELANIISISIGFCHSSLNPIVYCCTNINGFNRLNWMSRIIEKNRIQHNEEDDFFKVIFGSGEIDFNDIIEYKIPGLVEHHLTKQNFSSVFIFYKHLSNFIFISKEKISEYLKFAIEYSSSFATILSHRGRHLRPSMATKRGINN
ncbi:eptide Receptor family [Brachionus plicatilis]|uniref:Eptide Receptor family n=1 Tax=Brachionus plicatilis TaxID=10195 RepID=A0A3M7PVK5_BRAPC|nr:eptide Receptor family [Brachionus plicatilis]